MSTTLNMLLAEDQQRAFVERQISLLWHNLLGPQAERKPSLPPSADEHDKALRRGARRRARVFRARKWSMEQALALLIFFREFRELQKDNPLRLGVVALQESDARAQHLQEDESARPWVVAVAQSREDLARVDFEMHPLLWIRWASTFAPHSIAIQFWTEFGVWRRECGVYEPAVRGVDGEGQALVAPDGEDFGTYLIPLDSFVHGPIQPADYDAVFEVCSLTNVNSIRQGLADFLTKELMARVDPPVHLDPHRDRLARVTRRVGRGAIQMVAGAVAELRALDVSKTPPPDRTTWQQSGSMWLVDCERESLVDRVIKHLRATGEKAPALSTTRSAVSAFVDFPGSHRPKGRRRRSAS